MQSRSREGGSLTNSQPNLDLLHLEWAIEQRGKIQQTILVLYKYAKSQPPKGPGFPSDHATVFAGLTVVLYIARPTFITYAIIWTIVVESFRNYIGAHYPTDLIAGAGLGAFAVWASQLSWPTSAGKKMMRWEQSSPALFYMTAFLVSYQIATLFNDIRQTLGSLRTISWVTSAHFNDRGP